MPTIPQPYVYPIANIPGGQFNGDASSHLLALIVSQIPSGVNPVIGSDSINVTVSFNSDLSTTDKATLDSLVPHCADFFIITEDGGVTDLGNPANIMTAAGQNSATTITLQYKMGDGTNFNGFGEAIQLHSPIMTIDKIIGNFDGTGKFQFIIGSELNRGEVDIVIDSGSLPEKVLVAIWT